MPFFFASNQEALWLTTLVLDLGGTVLLYRLFGKAGLQVAIATAIILANLQGPKLMMSFGLMFLPSTNPDTAAFSSDIHNSFATILNFTPRFVFGSLLAYLISQRFDVWAFHKIKSMTGGRSLWLRNNGSTIASQAIDTVIYSLGQARLSHAISGRSTGRLIIFSPTKWLNPVSGAQHARIRRHYDYD